MHQDARNAVQIGYKMATGIECNGVQLVQKSEGRVHISIGAKPNSRKGPNHHFAALGGATGRCLDWCLFPLKITPIRSGYH